MREGLHLKKSFCLHQKVHAENTSRLIQAENNYKIRFVYSGHC